jgi:hypothetical protein
MNAKAIWCLSVCAMVGGGLILSSCSSGPKPPAPGTPAFFWAAAKETYAAGDYEKTTQHLSRICSSQNEYTARAEPWLLILTSGLAKANLDLANAFEAGQKARPYHPKPPYLRQITLFRTYASGYALQFAQALGELEKSGKATTIPLDFTFPTGSATAPAEMSKIEKGTIPAPKALEEIRQQELKTGVIQMTCRAVGAAEDCAKAQQLFQSGKAEAPRDAFMLAMATALHETGQLFSRAKLDDPDRLKLFNTRALETLKTLPENKETAALNNRIQKALKPVSAK